MSKIKYFFVIVFWFAIVFVLIHNCFSALREYNSGLKGKRNLVQIIDVEKKTNIIVLGDTGTGASEQYKVADAVAALCMRIECTAVFIAGDVIYPDGVASLSDDEFKTKFELPYQEIELPFYIAFGNHDYLGCTQCYLDYASKSTKWMMPSAYYKVSLDKTDYFVIDTESFTDAQQSWLKTGLQDSEANWKVVLGHKPLQTYDVTHFTEDWDGKDELKEIICSSTDVHISGHAHLLEYFEKIEGCSVNQIVSGGGGADPRPNVPNLEETFVYSGYGFVLISSNSDSFEITYYSNTGEELYKDRLNNKN